MKIILLFLIICTIAITNSRLLTEASCSVSQVYYPISVPVYAPSVDYSTSTIGSTIVSTGISQPVVISSYPVSTYTATVETSPFVVYYMRKGSQSWRVSVLDDANAKDYKVKGEKYLKEKTGEQWYSHDNKVDENFKAPFARCQAMNRELNSRKAFRTSNYESKVVKELPDLLEKVSRVNNVAVSPLVISKHINNEKKVDNLKVNTKLEVKKLEAVTENKITSVKPVEAKLEAPKNTPVLEKKPVVNIKAPTTRVETPKVEEAANVVSSTNTPNTPVENKKSAPKQTNFLQKVQKDNGDDAFGLNEEDDLEKFDGDSVAPVNTKEEVKAKKEDANVKAKTEKKNLTEKSESSDKDSESDDEESEMEDADKDLEKSNDSDNDEDNLDNLEAEDDAEKAEKSGDSELPDDENNELADDEKAIDIDEETDPVMNEEQEEDQEEMEEVLVKDLGKNNQSNQDLL
jgi:hypothetical protein